MSCTNSKVRILKILIYLRKYHKNPYLKRSQYNNKPPFTGVDNHALSKDSYRK